VAAVTAPAAPDAPVLPEPEVIDEAIEQGEGNGDKRVHGNRERTQRRRRSRTPKRDASQDGSDAVTTADSEANETSPSVLEPVVAPSGLDAQAVINELTDSSSQEPDPALDADVIAAAEALTVEPKVQAAADPSASAPNLEKVASVLGQAQNDPRVAPRPALEGPVSETVELIPVVHDLPFLSVDYDEGHPSRWQRASNDPRGMV